MGVPNKTSTFVWAYQAVVGTAIITAVNSVTYEFGEYNDECGKWSSPFVENSAEPRWPYNSRTCTLTDLESEFPIFPHVFNPVSAQFLAWMLGKPVDADPLVTIETLDTDMTYPLTIRLEEIGGTKPEVIQAVDCYCIGLTVNMERSKSMLVEAQFCWGSLEDFSVDARPILTTAPLAAGLMTGTYDGNPIVLWDIGGDNVSIPGVWRADFMCEQEFEKVSSGAGATQINYTYRMKPVKIILSAVFETDDSWEDYVNRKVSTNMTIQVKKHNATNYITYTFTNCRIVSIKKTGERNKGHYGAVCFLIAEKVEGTSDWFTEGGVTFATHWKANI